MAGGLPGAGAPPPAKMEPTRVDYVGLYPGAVVEVVHSAFRGTRFEVLSGELPPNRERLSAWSPGSPPFGKYASRESFDCVMHQNDSVYRANLTVRFLNVSGPYYDAHRGELKLGDEIGKPVRLEKGVFGRSHGTVYSTSLQVLPPVEEGEVRGELYDPERGEFRVGAHRGVSVQHGGLYLVAGRPQAMSSEEYCRRALESIGEWGREAMLAHDLLRKVEDQDALLPLMAAALRARPERVRIPGGPSLSIGQLHAVLGSLLLYRGEQPPLVNLGLARRQGKPIHAPEQYALLVGREVARHHFPVPAPLAAVAALSRAHGEWLPSPELLGACVRFCAAVCEENAPPPPPPSAALGALVGLCRELGMAPGPECGGHRGIRAEVGLHRLIYDRRLVYQADRGDPADMRSFLEAVEGTPRPWELAWRDAADLERAQLRHWEEVRGGNRGRPRLMGGRLEYTFRLTHGWIAAMCGVQEVSLGERGRVREACSVCLNVENILERPLVMRDRAVESDDLPEADKLAAGKEVLGRLAAQEGLRLRHVPKGLDLDYANYVRVVGEGAERQLCLQKYVTHGIQVVRSFPFAGPWDVPMRCECAGPVEREVEGSGDWRDLRYEDDTPCVRAEAEKRLGDLFRECTALEIQRAIAVMRNYDNFWSLPALGGAEDRKVYVLLCAISALCPGALRRRRLRFDVLMSPYIWTTVRKLLAMREPAHYPWDVPLELVVERVTRREVELLLREDGRRLPLQGPEAASWRAPYAKALEICPEILYEPVCSRCCVRPPVVLFTGCGHVSGCAGCLASDGGAGSRACFRCGRQSLTEGVPPAPRAWAAREGRVLGMAKEQEMFPWQQKAFDRLTAFLRPAEVVWLPPGAGKTYIVLKYILWCNANACMTAGVLWATVLEAVPNLEAQAAAAGIRTHRLGKGELPRPGVISIVGHDAMRLLDMEMLGPLLPDVTFVLDEFHACMSGTTLRSAAALTLARGAYRTIAMSGTIFKNRNSPGELAEFLSLCVDFRLDAHNYLVGLGLMLTYRVESKSLIRRSERVVPEPDPPGTPGAWVPDPERKSFTPVAHAVELGVLGACLELVHKGHGVVATAHDLTRAEHMRRALEAQGVRAAVLGAGGRAIDLGPGDSPDPRGPGFVAEGPLEMPDGTPSTSHTIPQVVIVPLSSDRFLTGYNLNRYNHMVRGISEMNQSAIEQLEGRIDRANNDALHISYCTVYAKSQQGLFDAQYRLRLMSESHRDVQEGDDSTRRRMDHEERQQRLRAAQEAADRARKAQEEADERAREAAEAGRPPSAEETVAAREGCAYLNVEFGDMRAALLSRANRAYRLEMVKWHPDKWASASQQERDAAEGITKLLNRHIEAIRKYCEKQ